MKVFASIYVGSYAVSLKVFEISKNKRLKQIDYVRAHIELLEDIYRNGKVSAPVLSEIIKAVFDFNETAKMYRADEVYVYGGNSLLRAENILFVIDQIRIQTGMELDILDNVRQRYMSYQAVANDKIFTEMAQDRMVIIDVGGASIQLSLFENGEIINSQHIFIGATNVVDKLRRLDQKADYREQMLEMLQKEVSVYYKMFLNRVPPNKLIIVHNQLIEDMSIGEEKMSTVSNAKDYLKLVKKQIKSYYYDVSEKQPEEDFDELRLSFLLLYQSMMEQIPVEEVYVPLVSMHEGVAYAYAYAHKLLKAPRDFEQDVLSQAWAIAERYNSYTPHLKALDQLSCLLFDAMKKRHGLSPRCRLLLRVSAILHDCGKYISMAEAANCTYIVINSSEILGLDEKELKMIATVAYFHRKPIRSYEEMEGQFTKDEYFTIVKLVAMLRVANALDKSHKQKAKNVRMALNAKDELVITVDAQVSLTLERGLFEEKTKAFIDVFGIRPLIREVRK